ncbi:MAG: ATP phosphoribosyltransferase regulatory subunit [Clostridia bacterium]|nr:ATP phosphoribosyltransferase regulatory subunit [Clostridia bacterium]
MEVMFLNNEKVTHTPKGLSDILWDECDLKFRIETVARETFSKHGYKMVQTPTFEYFDVYHTATPNKAESMFKFFDVNGRMLALRPDFTTSIARLAATKSLGEDIPLKLSYSGSTFRNDEAFSQARQREFSQVGIELIGENKPEADAEVISVVIETLLAAGMKQFQIDIGQVGYFMELAKQAQLNPEQADQLRSLINDKDFVAIEQFLNILEIPEELKKIFAGMPTQFGEVSVIQTAMEQQGIGNGAKAALKNLEQIYQVLAELHYEQYISIDLGMVPHLDYYTGMIFKGFTYGVGFPICSGGRYDTLMEKFGKKQPATGAAIGVERLMAALQDEKGTELSKTEASEYVTVALAKGRLAELSIEIFGRLGFDVAEMQTKTRKLIFTDTKKKFRFILVKASDVPTYVEYGAADIGVVGKDTLLESGKDLYEVLDLGFGTCKMAVAGPAELKGKLEGRNIMRVASKYPEIARDYFHGVKGQTVDIIKLNGSVELGPLVGLSEVIVDIVESGKTLHENGLTVLEDVCPLSARLVVNRVSMKLHRKEIVDLIEKIKGELD